MVGVWIAYSDSSSNICNQHSLQVQPFVSVCLSISSLTIQCTFLKSFIKMFSHLFESPGSHYNMVCLPCRSGVVISGLCVWLTWCVCLAGLGGDLRRSLCLVNMVCLPCRSGVVISGGLCVWLTWCVCLAGLVVISGGLCVWLTWSVCLAGLGWWSQEVSVSG